MKLLYKNKSGDTINITSHYFMELNYNKCNIIFKNQKFEFRSSLIIGNKENTEVKIKVLENIRDISFMFHECNLLKYVKNIPIFNKIINMNCLFYGCSSLELLPDISKWNINDVRDLSGIFYGCSSLKSIPDISSWNTNKVTNMTDLFRTCSSLKSLPDISK